MNMSEELKRIKKLYGEEMCYFCRDSFATLLETPCLVLTILNSSFAPSHELFQDLEENGLLLNFKEYVYKKNYLKKISIEKKAEDKSKIKPAELLKKVGYTLFECKTETDIQFFKKYYADGEELCTFRGKRLDTCHVFFAVKDNVDEINRVDFINPKRQDEYGTSVISIQFSRDETHTLSIKNRYNHTVLNPDATFGNNLDNIILGLTESFEYAYGLKQQHRNDFLEIPRYVRANDGKWYKFNYEINNVYYCPNNIIIDNYTVKPFPKEKYIIIDYFIIDLVNKEILLYDLSILDTFSETVTNIKKITITKENKDKVIEIIHENNEVTRITVSKTGKMKAFYSSFIKEVLNRFLYQVDGLNKISLPKLLEAGNFFAESAIDLEEIEVPKLGLVGDDFLYYCAGLISFDAPNLRLVGHSFLSSCIDLKSVNLPKLTEVGHDFLFSNENLERIFLPNLVRVGDNFLYCNVNLSFLCLPNLEEAKADFLFSNTDLSEMYLPKLKKVADSFLYNNTKLTCLYLPSLVIAGENFLKHNDVRNQIYLKSLLYTDQSFLKQCSENFKTYLESQMESESENDLVVKNLERKKKE